MCMARVKKVRIISYMPQDTHNTSINKLPGCRAVLTTGRLQQYIEITGALNVPDAAAQVIGSVYLV